MNLLYLHAAIPVGFFKVRVIISCCIFRHELAIVWLMLSLLFLAKPTVLFQINVFCGSRAEAVLRQFLLPDSVERVLEQVSYLQQSCPRS